MPVLAWLTRLPRWLVGLIPGALLLGALVTPPPWGSMLLVLVTLFLAWLLVLSWPRLDTGSRALRTVAVLVAGAAAVAHSAGII